LGSTEEYLSSRPVRLNDDKNCGTITSACGAASFLEVPQSGGARLNEGRNTTISRDVEVGGGRRTAPCYSRVMSQHSKAVHDHDWDHVQDGPVSTGGSFLGEMRMPVKLEHQMIVGMIAPNSSVLDLGCGDGQLMDLITRRKSGRCQGIEIDEQAIYTCVGKGLSVFHGDLNTGLVDFMDGSFDYVILDQTLQQLEKPDEVLSDALRVGNMVIVVFPNFAHYSARLQMLLKGRSPVTPFLPYEWHDTPNLRFFSTLDFQDYCCAKGIRVKRSVYTSSDRVVRLFPNFRSQLGIFLIQKIFSPSRELRAW
jgi:methionine biosynthesis protein MetW